MLRLSIAFAAATILALLLIAAPARGQVAIGPGSVTAPFVHVEWGNGQVHVCRAVCESRRRRPYVLSRTSVRIDPAA